MVFYLFYKIEIERSLSLILGILGNLAHFRHSFFSLYQPVLTRGGSKDRCDKVELVSPLHLTATFFQKTFIMPAKHVRFHLSNGINRHANHNEKGCATKIKWDVKLRDKNRWQYTDRRNIDSTAEGYSGQHFINIIGGTFAGTNPGDIPAGFFHIVGDIDRIKGNSGIKIAKEKDKCDE